jgi:hypothetical protein
VISVPALRVSNYYGAGASQKLGREGVSSSVLNVTVDCSDAASVAILERGHPWPYSKQQMSGGTFWVVGVPGGLAHGWCSLMFLNPSHVPVIGAGVC